MRSCASSSHLRMEFLGAAIEKSIQRRFLSFARRPRNKKLRRCTGQTVPGLAKEDWHTSFRGFRNCALRQDTFEADQCSINLSARAVWNSPAFFRELAAQAYRFSLALCRLKHSTLNTRLNVGGSDPGPTGVQGRYDRLVVHTPRG